MKNNKYYEEKWYTYLKKKYQLDDDDMAEYIDSFDLINKGLPITASILSKFINDEIDGKNHWSIDECAQIINKINFAVHKKEIPILSLKTYLYYVIPICQNYFINNIGTKEFFNSLDTNRQGKITCKQLIQILYKLNLTQTDIKKYKARIKKLCKSMDANGDKFISFEEFKKFMERITFGMKI